MYLVYANADLEEGKGPMLLAGVFRGTEFEQAHYFVCCQKGVMDRPQDTITLEDAEAAMVADGDVVYPDYRIEYRAIDVHDWKEQYINKKKANKTKIIEKVTYDLEEQITELKSVGLSDGEISRLLLKVSASR